VDKIQKIKSISIWIFLVPFISVNTCLILITEVHFIFPNQEHILWNTFPYIDGGASISRVTRNYPNWLIFKPAMFFTSFLLIKYWIYNREVIQFFNKDHKYIKRIFFFGICSAVALTIHSIFLGIKFDNDLYKLFRRVIMLSFIVFEVVAQTYLVITLYSFKDKLIKYINLRYLKIKFLLVTILIIVAVISIPLVSLSGDDFLGFNLKFLKHSLEWDYFLGIIIFYLLSFKMWKNKI
jgi:hypothetical protein